MPDPASRWQPDGVHGPSRVYDQAAYEWHDGDWAGRDLTAAVVYELHIGTFTPGATFDSAIERLDHLVELGVTHVELLPVNAFNGVWNWGYDGVDLVRGARAATAARTGSSASSTPRTRAGWPSCSTSSTTTSGRRATTCRASGPT